MRNALLNIPTTKLRILVSLALTIWTAYTVLVSGTVVSTEWLVFLAANTGIDLGAYTINKKLRIASEAPSGPSDGAGQ